MCNYCKSKTPEGVCDNCLHKVAVLLKKIKRIERNCDRMLNQILEGGELCDGLESKEKT